MHSKRFAILLVVLTVSVAGVAAAKSRRSPALSDKVFDAALDSFVDPAPLDRLLSKGPPNGRDKRGNSTLGYAVGMNRLSVVKGLLKRGADPNGVTHFGKRPLHVIIYSNSDAAALVRVLLDAGAKVDSRDRDGRTPLMDAADAPSPSSAYLLMARGADVNARAKDGNTPLISAARTDAPDLMRALLKRGARVNDVDKEGMSAVIRSAMVGASNSFHLLLSKGAKLALKTPSGDSLLTSAILWGSPSIIRELLKRGADPNDGGAFNRPPILQAARRDDSALLKLLLDAGADVKAADEEGKTALHSAADAGNLENVQLLLERGADPNREDKEGVTPIRLAKRGLFASEEVVEALLKGGALPPKIQLAEAIESESLEDVRAALARGEDPNQIAPVDLINLLGGIVTGIPAMTGGFQPPMPKEGEPPALLAEGQPILARAILKCSKKPEIVAALLDAGAKADFRDMFGNTPLHLAAIGGGGPLVELLIDRTKGMKEVDKGGNTPLLSAAVSGNTEAVKTLLAKGADSKVRNNVELGALHLVLVAGMQSKGINPEVVKALIQGGADPNVPGPKRVTPLMLAIMQYSEEAEQAEAVEPDEEPAKTDSDKAIAAIRKGSKKLQQKILTDALKGEPSPETQKLQKGAQELLEKVPPKVGDKLQELGGQLAEALLAETWDGYQFAEHLLSNGADPNGLAEEGHRVSSAAIYAEMKRPADGCPMLRLLVKGGMKLDVIAEDDYTPLASAAAQGSPKVVSALLALGADPNLAVGVPPVIAAIVGEEAGVLQLILRKGGNPNTVHEGAPALVHAVTGGNLDAVRLLLAKGANPNAKDEKGTSALRTAANLRFGPAVTALKRAGAKP